jgi:flagellin FlaB
MRGITGLETAIVLIAFVVVSSVFAFAALSTGLFSADKSKETIKAGLDETSGTLELRGSVVSKAGSATGSAGIIDKLIFQVANAAGGQSVNLTQGKTIIKYTDDNQTFLFDTTSEFLVTGDGNADSDKLVEPGEIYRIALNALESSLSPDLSTGDTFIVELIPPEGAVVHIERTTPVFIESFNDLN